MSEEEALRRAIDNARMAADDLSAMCKEVVGLTTVLRPSFNHTRDDALYDPCPECLALMSRTELIMLVKDLQTTVVDLRYQINDMTFIGDRS